MSSILEYDIILPSQFNQNIDYSDSFFKNNQPTTIGIDIAVKEEIYTYSVNYDSEKISFEELLDVNENVIFSRKLVSGNYEYNIPNKNLVLNDEQLEVGDGLLKQVQLSTIPQRLFLRHLLDNNCKKLESLKQCICQIFYRLNPYFPEPVVVKSIDAKDFSLALNQPNINDFRYAVQNLKNNKNFVNNKEHLMKSLKSIGMSFNDLRVVHTGDGNVQQIFSQYVRDNGQVCELDFIGAESDGTKKFISYLALIDWFVNHDGVFIVDELDTNFHPLLVKEIIRTINNSDSRVQLIFTTHNPVLWGEDLFEKDQIYFTSKNAKLATELYSLADFSDLDEDNWLYKYLSGKFGAIPHINSLNIMGDR